MRPAQRRSQSWPLLGLTLRLRRLWLLLLLLPLLHWQQLQLQLQLLQLLWSLSCLALAWCSPWQRLLLLLQGG